MKYALVNGLKSEATKGAKGTCQSCESEMYAHCGQVYANHWKHKRKYKCDSWWESETSWHRAWKDHFPNDWQEIRHPDQNTGEVHIADVKTDGEWVLEFQHSVIKPEERASRGMFYPKLNWVIDVGSSPRKTDQKQLRRVINEGTKIISDFYLMKIDFPEECRLLREWCNRKDFVFFDCSGADNFKKQDFWMLFPVGKDGNVYVTPISREHYIEWHQNNIFDQAIKNITSTINKRIQLDNMCITESPTQIAQRNFSKRSKRNFRF
jgi:competence protein CoiA